MPDCSLVIRAYNEAQHIGRLLEGVHRQTLRNVEIILVDSGSTDGTPAIAAGYGAQVIHLSPSEFTFGNSLNLGIGAATSKLIAIASAHVYPVYPDWLESILAPFITEQTALSYGKQRGDLNSKYSEHQIFTRWYPDQPNANQAHPFCNNANAAIRRSLWEQHPYDEKLTGLEDIAWAKWAQSQGFAICYVPRAEVVHVHNESPRIVRSRYQREGMAFHRIFPEAHFSLYDFIRYLLSNIFFDLYHAARSHQLVGSFSSIIWFRFNQFFGTYQGYRQSGLLTPNLRQTFYYHTGWTQHPPSKKMKMTNEGMGDLEK